MVCAEVCIFFWLSSNSRASCSSRGRPVPWTCRSLRAAKMFLRWGLTASKECGWLIMANSVLSDTKQNRGNTLRFPSRYPANSKTRRERLKSAGAQTSKAQKGQNNFLEKTWKFWFFSFRKCRIVPKNGKGEPFGVFQHPFCRKTSKNRRGKFLFSEKILQCRKKLKGGTFGIFQHPFWRKTAKKLKEAPFGEKVLQCRKKLKGGPFWSRPVWYVTRKNRINLFGSVR